MHFASRDLGPHRFTPRRPPAFVPALKSALALETAKSGHSRGFDVVRFSFFNSIGAKRSLWMSRYSRYPDLARTTSSR
jgi:hypothetical protein